MIRDGKEKDLNQIVEMAREFWKHTIYDEEYCPDTVYAMASLSLEQNLMAVLEIDGDVKGFACAIKGSLLGNASISTGTELAWWIEPDCRQNRDGIRLLEYLETLAKNADIKHWNMVYMESSMPAIVEEIYKKMGYRKAEVVYNKVL